MLVENSSNIPYRYWFLYDVACILAGVINILIAPTNFRCMLDLHILYWIRDKMN